MKRQEDAERRASLIAAERRVRKPYHKPEVRYERVFEQQALTCGKVQTTQGQCHYNRKTS